MCGRYAIATPHFSRIEQALGTDFQAVQPRYNIAPTQNIPIIRQAKHGYELVELRWGLIPFWSKTPTTEYSTFNARIVDFHAKLTQGLHLKLTHREGAQYS